MLWCYSANPGACLTGSLHHAESVSPHGDACPQVLHHHPAGSGHGGEQRAGYYEDGSFGVRIENLVHVVEADTPFRFGGVPFFKFERLTMCPLQRRMIDFEVGSCPITSSPHATQANQIIRLHASFSQKRSSSFWSLERRVLLHTHAGDT